MQMYGTMQKIVKYLGIAILIFLAGVVVGLTSGCGSKDLTSVEQLCVQEHKICICHFPPGNPDNPQEICIDEHAWQAHQRHYPDDYIGPCRKPDAGTIDSGPTLDSSIQSDTGPSEPDATVTEPDATVTEPDAAPLDAEVIGPDSGDKAPVVPDNKPPLSRQSYAVTGGCNTGPSDTPIFLLGLLMLLVSFILIARKKWKLALIVFIVSIALFSAVSEAQAFPTQNFKPAPGTSDYWVTEDAKTSLPTVQLLWQYENDPLRLVDNQTGQTVENLINHRHTLHLLGAYSFGNSLQVALDVPLVIGQWNGDLSAVGPLNPEGGLGGVRFALKANLASFQHFAVGLVLGMGLPTSTVDYVDDGGFNVFPKLLASGYFGPVTLSINAGMLLRAPESVSKPSIATIAVENEFHGSAGVSLALWQNENVSFTAVSDIFAHVPLQEAASRNVPLELINGLNIGMPEGINIRLGAGVGLNNGVGTPDFRLLGGLQWTFGTEKPCQLIVKPPQVQVVQLPPKEVPLPVPVPIINPIYFEFDKDTLTLQAQATLLDDIDVLQEIGQYVEIQLLVLIGRADKRGTDTYNLNLAQRRANTVKEFLISNGISNVEIQTKSEGEINANQNTTDETIFQRDRTVIIVPILAQ